MMASTFALENFPKSVEEIKLGNQWVPQYLKIPISHSFEHNKNLNKANTRAIVGSSKLLGMQNFIRLLCMLPFNLAKLSISILARKITMTYSNMPSPTKNHNYNGAICKSIFGFLPAVGDMMCGIVAISHGQVLKIGLITEKHYIQEP